MKKQPLLDEEEVERVLNATDEPNAPLAIPGVKGLGGSKPHVSSTEARKRRTYMSYMLASGVAMDKVHEECQRLYGFTEEKTRELIKEVRAQWDEEDGEAGRYAKHAARRRILGAIRVATKEKKWHAVANLEKTLAEVEGTSIPVEEKTEPVDARLTEAIMAELGAQDEKSVRLLIQRERTYVELSASARDAGAVIVTTEGEET